MVLMKRSSPWMTGHDINLKRFRHISEPTLAEITERSFDVKGESTSNDSEHDEVKYCSNTKIVITGLDDDGDMTLARLRCLGIEMNNANFSIEEEEKPVSRMLSKSQKEKELRRERGEMLVKLFREHPRLADSATTRKAEKNLERAQMWEKITCEVNDTFGSRLEILSVEKVKKLLSYYKKRDDGICDSIKTFGESNACDNGNEAEQLCTTPSSRCDSISSEHGGFENDNITSMAILNEANVGRQSLCSVTSLSSSSCSGSLKKLHQTVSTPAVIFGDTTYQLKKERNNFVVSLAEYYMERMCFNSSSRSAQVNAERHNMWLKIAKLTNDKYMGLLNPLGLEQTKKLFSNCKSRRRLPFEKKDNDVLVASNLTASLSTSSEEISVGQNNNCTDVSSDAYLTSTCEQPKGLEHGRDTNFELGELHRQLADREAEMEHLRRRVVEQGDEYRNQINAVVDILKTAVDKVFENIRIFLGVA